MTVVAGCVCGGFRRRRGWWGSSSFNFQVKFGDGLVVVANLAIVGHMDGGAYADVVAE